MALQSDFVNGGKVNLSFAQSDFYTQIESITLNDVKWILLIMVKIERTYKWKYCSKWVNRFSDKS